jgi:uracil-DNA glycosylase family 4
LSGLIPPGSPGEAPSDCPLCPRLAAFRHQNRIDIPDGFNDPVPSFGDASGRLLILGLAPGLWGANYTGRPFTGDYAGDLLYATLLKYGLANGVYLQRPDDGLTLRDCLISNAVRCVPPQNKPTPEESNTCRRFLVERIGTMPNLKAILALGKIAHDSALRALGLKLSAAAFIHCGEADLPGPNGPVRLVSSYHCSRYNTNTRRLTEAMFEDAVRQAMKAAGL